MTPSEITEDYIDQYLSVLSGEDPARAIVTYLRAGRGAARLDAERLAKSLEWADDLLAPESDGGGTTECQTCPGRWRDGEEPEHESGCWRPVMAAALAAHDALTRGADQ